MLNTKKLYFVLLQKLLALVVLMSGPGCAATRSSAPESRTIADITPSLHDYAAQQIASIIAVSSAESLRENDVAEGLSLLALTDRFDAIEVVRNARQHHLDAGTSLNDLYNLIRALYRTDEYVLTERMDRFLQSWIREMKDREMELVKRLDQELDDTISLMHRSLFWLAQYSKALELSGSAEFMAFARRILSRDLPIDLATSDKGFFSLSLKLFPLLLAIEDGDWREAHRLLESGIIDSPDRQRLLVRFCSGQLVRRLDIYIWLRDRLNDPEALFCLDIYAAFAFPDNPDHETVLRAIRYSITQSLLPDQLRCSRLEILMVHCALGGYWNLFDEISEEVALYGPPSANVLHFLATEGEFDRLDKMRRKMDDSVPERAIQLLLARALSVAGRRDEARTILDRIDCLRVSDLNDLQAIAYIYGLLGDIDTGIDVIHTAHKYRRERTGEDWHSFELFDYASLLLKYRQSGASPESLNIAIDKIQLCNASKIYIWAQLGRSESFLSRVLWLGGL